VKLDKLERHGWTVTLPVDAALARLLRQAQHDHATSPGTRREIGVLASTAERRPEAGARAARLQAPLVQAVADDLGRALARARTAGDPGAGSLAAFAAEWFGVTEETEETSG
jgi:hypothetical protein